MDILTRRLARLITSCSLATLAACGTPATLPVLQYEKEAVVNIAGGIECDPQSLQAVGALVSPDKRTVCTGALIAEDIVLTAAHCVEGEDPARLLFTLGAEPTKAEGLPIAGWIQHPRYKGDSRGAHDLALVQLQKPVPAVPPLPFSKRPLPGYFRGRLTFVGYGNNDGAAKTGSGLKRCVRMPVSQVNEFTFMTQTPGQNTCHGDSGGPVLNYRNGKWELVGVIASGDSLCERVGFSARVDVRAMSEWIARTQNAERTARPSVP